MIFWTWTLLIGSAVLGVAYVVLGLKANDHLNRNSSRSDHSIEWLFWWSASKDIYDEEGKKLCAKGQMFALVLFALYAAWYLLL